MQGAIAGEHIEQMFSHYGTALGVRNARKHIGWYIERSGVTHAAMKEWRRKLCTLDDAQTVLATLREFYAALDDVASGQGGVSVGDSYGAN
jgi:tRNA-dihydrouridine synthase